MNISVATPTLQIQEGRYKLHDRSGRTSDVYLNWQPLPGREENALCVNAAKSNSRIRALFYDAVEKIVTDLEARAWQHEIDHLNGVLFIDMMGPIAKLSSRTAVKNFERAFRRAQEKGEIPHEVEIEKILAALESQA